MSRLEIHNTRLAHPQGIWGMLAQMTFVISQPSKCQVAAFATKLLINDRSVASESGKIFATINLKSRKGKLTDNLTMPLRRCRWNHRCPSSFRVVVPTRSCSTFFERGL